jgi:Na+/H+-translocating membrane pyrophosphatase
MLSIVFYIDVQCGISSVYFAQVFICFYVLQDEASYKLTPERCIRLKNGFLSTEREVQFIYILCVLVFILLRVYLLI